MVNYIRIPFRKLFIYVAPDYYMVDGVRISVNRYEAEQIAAKHGAVLPTAEMVDAIWKAADLKLAPIPMTPGPQMTSQAYVIEHNRLIQQQIGATKYNLVAGHKKDVIQSQRDGRITIYGWHRPTGRPIQPVSNVHSADYKDYSHGLRLIRIP